MSRVGVIMLSLGGTPELQQMTQNAIDSCVSGDESIDFTVVVCESVEGITYTRATTAHPPGNQPFNYNGYLNSCRTLSEFEGCEYIALCNNDLIFEKEWASTLIKKMKEHNVMSACPMDPTVHADVKFKDGVSFGHTITLAPRHVAGWCIFQDLHIYDTIKELNTEAQFWHADTTYANQLTELNIAHMLVEDSKVHHLRGQTIGSSLIPDEVRNLYTEASPLNIRIKNAQHKYEQNNQIT